MARPAAISSSGAKIAMTDPRVSPKVAKRASCHTEARSDDGAKI